MKRTKGYFQEHEEELKKAEPEIYEGVFTAHPRGFGFVTVEGLEQDLFIPESETHGAFHMDTVRVKVLPEKSGMRTQARVIKVLSHSITELVGTFQRSVKYGFVVPDNKRILEDIFVPREEMMGAQNKDKVLVHLNSYGGAGMKPEGKIIRIIGGADEPGTDILSLVYAAGIPVEFPEEVLAEARSLPQKVSRSDRRGRLDLRDLMTVTVDGDDTKDFDDAVSLTFDGKNYHLGVHIADVSEYVREGSPLDKEAVRRGTSVYLTDRVIPMLPLELSNGICSLNQGEDRLTLSCLMTFGKRGKLKDVQVAESVIRVDRRETYNIMTKILEGDKGLRKEHGKFLEMYEMMDKLSTALRKRRVKRGSIDFDFPESHITVDEKGKPVAVEKRERNRASLIIEDFMLAANEAVAQVFCKEKVPFLYRNHGTPDPEKIKELECFAGAMGFTLKNEKEKAEPKDVQELLEKIKGSEQEAAISHLVLRSMQQAKYGSECEGHFGLAAKYYCHFTSPIRRYPDTQIHRIIKEVLRGKTGKKWKQHYENLLPAIGVSCSQQERAADELERAADKMKKAEFMKDHIGEKYDGVISGITGWGIYVELPNTVEGMIHVSNMFDDHYDYREETYDMAGEHTGKVYSLGQKVRIEVIDADKENRIIDFKFA